MSYFEEKFNTVVHIFELGESYYKDDVVLYNKRLYMALKDTSEAPTPKSTDENWEYIDPNSTTRVIANLGCVNNGYRISVGTQDAPFYSLNAFNSVNITVKNKTNVPGFLGTLRFGKDMSDNGSSVNINVLYDQDYQNPSLIGVTERLDKINLGTGIHRFKDIYLTSSPISLSDKESISEFTELDDKYLTLFSKLTPVEYKLDSLHGYGSSNRTHIGFFANDIEAAMEEVGLSSNDFAGLVKIPILKKDIYKDNEINSHDSIHCHLENGVEVVNTDTDYKEYLTGENVIRYSQLPIYKKELGYLYFKNYPLGSFEMEDFGEGINQASDMDIIIKSIELIPYDDSDENYKLDFSELIIIDEDRVIENTKAYHEILEDGSLKLSFDENAKYNFVRISFKPDGTNLDCSKYKYLKIISDFKQPYLMGFSDAQSAEEVDNAIDYNTSEYGDMYSYAQDNQFEVATYIYAIRYEEFIALNTKKIQAQDAEIANLKKRLDELEILIKNNN